MARPVKLAHDAVHADDLDKTRLSAGTRRVVDAINAMPLLGARLLSSATFTAGTPRSIEHGLGRPAKGFFEVYGVDATTARVGLFPSAYLAGESSATHIRVTPTASGTCSILVF